MFPYQAVLFYKRAYEDSSQNALWHYMVEYFTRRYTELAKKKLSTDILDTQLAYSIRFYCMGAVGMTQEWVLTDNITSAETVVQMMFHSMPENLRKILFQSFIFVCTHFCTQFQGSGKAFFLPKFINIQAGLAQTP